MRNEIREAYQIEKRTKSPESNAAKPLTDFVEMSDEIKQLYERAMGKVEDQSASSKPLSELPRTEDIFRQSAPAHMKNLPSDESVYRPSESPIPPAQHAIEEDDGPRRLAITIFAVILLASITFVVIQYMS
jgi:hypothetical protein